MRTPLWFNLEIDMHTLATIGYEGTTMDAFLGALRDAHIELLVDVRAVASSRRPGFAKTALAANLAGAGIEYLHLRGLGTPADGRAAARAGKHEVMHRIYAEHLETRAAEEGLATLRDIVASGRRTCIMCFEARPEHCHRTLVARALNAIEAIRVLDLMPQSESSV
jgi:uncharacterized protein (DUF488 family)